MMYKAISLRIWTLVLLGGLCISAFAQREIRTINDNWKFFKGECRNASDSSFNDTGWIQVNLPHTWNTDAYTEKDYYQGIGWYRRNVEIPSGWRGRRVYLKQEAASKASVLFVNGRSVGKHAGGYTAAMFDITPFIVFGKNNTLALQVDNACQDVPPISGDFTFFGGIYRDVWLIAMQPQHFHIDEYGAENVFITTPEVSEEKGSIAVQGRIKNDAAEKVTLEVETSIYSPDGIRIGQSTSKLRLEGGETCAFRQMSGTIRHPLLWTPETPYLYKVEVALRNPRTDEVIDRTIHHTAFRWFRFDGKKGFFLNGKPYKLHGICRHQDQKPIGAALSDEMHRRDFRLMKEMGANFIRISHYPQDDALLEMCDKLGMLAWEEIPVIDIVPEAPGYGDCCERNLREMIRQHYNHPSIIMWGYMNEILLVTQRKYKTEAQLQSALERTLALANRLEQVLKEEDSGRVSTMAFHGSNVYNEVGLGKVTDIVGWNLYSGWYGDDLKGFERFLEEQQRNYPDHPVIVSEYGAGSDKRLHSLCPRPFDFSGEYQQRYLEHYLPVLENTPYVCGGAHWNFIDFSSALRDESMPRINNKGLVYADRTPKDAYYYYQAMWRTDIPVLHIASRDWNRRCGVCQGDSAVILPVKVYTNLPEVELFIDGRSAGRKKVENRHAVFDVPFSGKSPYLSACGECQGQKVYDGLRVDFTVVPAQLDEKNLRTLELAVNVGSDCFFTSDESQLTWVPDRPYTKGSWGYVGGKPQSSQTEIHQTADGPLYQTLREGLQAYRFDVLEGTYEVELFFADIFKAGETVAYQLGRTEGVQTDQNRFRVVCNGQLLEELAPGETNGHFQALRKKYIVRNASDHINLEFEVVAGKCFLNGIKLRKLH